MGQMPTPTNTGVPQQVSNQPTGVQYVKNNITGLDELEITLSVGASSTITSNVLIIPSNVPSLLISKLGCKDNNQTATTGNILTSSISPGSTAADYTEFKNYLNTLGFHIKYWRFTTSNTAVYDGNLFVGQVTPNGILNPQKIPLSIYATSVGSGSFDKTLQIYDRPFNNVPGFFAYLSAIPAGTTLTIALGIDKVADTLAFM